MAKNYVIALRRTTKRAHEQVNSLLPNDLACVQHDQATQLNANA